MPDSTGSVSPLQAVMRGLGLGGVNGLSFETNRAMLREGVIEAPTGTPVAPAGTPGPEMGSATLSSPPVAPSAGQGGPSIDPADMARIQAQQRVQGQSNLQRIMEQRAKLIQGLPK